MAKNIPITAEALNKLKLSYQQEIDAANKRLDDYLRRDKELTELITNQTILGLQIEVNKARADLMEIKAQNKRLEAFIEATKLNQECLEKAKEYLNKINLIN